MKVMLINNLGYAAGGAEKNVFHIKEGLEKRGHTVQILTTDKIPDGKTSSADHMISGIRARGLVKFIKYSWNEEGRRQVKQAVRSFQPDVIHIHNIGEFGPSVLWGFSKNIPALMTVHGPEGFVKKLLPWQLPASDYKQHSYKKKDLRLIGRFRTGYFLGIQRPLYRLGMRRLRLVIAPSNFMLETLRADLKHEKLLRLPYGLELLSQTSLTHYASVLYVGRIEAVKGIHALLQAMEIVSKKMPRAELVIVGDGSERKHLESQVKRAQLSCVTFAGWVEGDKINEYYKRATLLVVPSIWPENFPFAALQALGMGRAIIGSNVGGIPEIINDNKNGFVVAPEDPAALAAAIMRILRDRLLATNMGQQSVELAKEFEMNSFIDQLEALYKSL